ncbi:uncharacterized protein [Primulina eburnea]|uniref:uncharacterized protein n=1 Tax=Primulina eburnea TaxID=1245227 RepID=UPI003C6BE4FC
MRSVNQALADMKSSLTEQIRTGFAEMRSNMPVQEDRDYSIVYTRGRKRKASEADFGVDDNLAREIASTSQTLHMFEPNLPVIIEESSEDIQVTPVPRKSGGEATTSRGVSDNLGWEIGSGSQTQQIFEPNLEGISEESAGDIQVTPDARMSGGEATTSRDAGVRPLAETVTLKVNNSLARVRASMLDGSPSRIRGFYAEYEKSFYGPMVIANSRVTFLHIGEALRGLLEMQIRHPEVMSADDSLMDRDFYSAISVLAEAKDIDFNINLAPIVSKVKGSDPEWSCLSWEKARRILIAVYTDGCWFLLKLVTGVNKCIIYDLQRRYDPKFKDLNEDIEPILINAARLLSIVGNNPHPERPCYIF